MNLQKIIFIETDPTYISPLRDICSSLDLASRCTILPAIPSEEGFFREVEQYCLFSADNTIVILGIGEAQLPAAGGFIHAFKSAKILKRVPLIIICPTVSEQDVNNIMLTGINSFFNRPDPGAGMQTLVEGIIGYWALEYVR